MKTQGFIILRHVNSVKTSLYWKISYRCIRKHYPENLILIIDDNSNYNFINKKDEETLHKTTIIKSEYPRRGELLPYIYYLKNKLFDSACIIHDSVFINKYIDLTVDKYKFIWEFEHDWDQIADETKMIKMFKDEKLLLFYKNKSLWKGCFGGMSIITHDYLSVVNNKYNLNKLLDCVLTRHNRMSFERVIACLLQYNSPKKCLLGNIHKYCSYGIQFHELRSRPHITNLPIIKVWTGR